MTTNTSVSPALPPDEESLRMEPHQALLGVGRKKTAWGMLIAIIAMNLAVVWINVRLNRWSADFYNALQTKNVRDFPHLLMIFSGLAFGYIILAVYGRYMRQMLGFRWRQWLTSRAI